LGRCQGRPGQRGRMARTPRPDGPRSPT
jgi:hypothetical protein